MGTPVRIKDFKIKRKFKKIKKNKKINKSFPIQKKKPENFRTQISKSGMLALKIEAN